MSKITDWLRYGAFVLGSTIGFTGANDFWAAKGDLQVLDWLPSRSTYQEARKTDARKMLGNHVILGVLELGAAAGLLYASRKKNGNVPQISFQGYCLGVGGLALLSVGGNEFWYARERGQAAEAIVGPNLRFTKQERKQLMDEMLTNLTYGALEVALGGAFLYGASKSNNNQGNQINSQQGRPTRI
ncbi:hypothetical protein HYU23_00380 [Candidatus Woesearchaeota archaeon]|nr:hypothetical protein [Candidatus Woesearchaeota archaeon]